MSRDYLDEQLSLAYNQIKERVYLESFNHALSHDNLELIEILIHEGFDYTQPLPGGSSAIILAIEKEAYKVFVYISGSLPL